MVQPSTPTPIFSASGKLRNIFRKEFLVMAAQVKNEPNTVALPSIVKSERFEPELESQPSGNARSDTLSLDPISSLDATLSLCRNSLPSILSNTPSFSVIHRLPSSITNPIQLFQTPRDEILRIFNTSHFNSLTPSQENEQQLATLFDTVSTSVLPSRLHSPPTALDLQQFNFTQVHRLSLGDDILDSLFLGGVRPGEILEIFGEAGAGKTQIVLQLLLNVPLSFEHGGLQGESLFLCSEDYPQTRIEALAKAWSEKFDTEEKKFNFLETIHLRRCQTLGELEKVVFGEEVIRLISSNNIKLIVIDSLAALVRHEFTSEREDMTRRAEVLARLSQRLKKLADHFAVCVVIINQVSERIAGLRGDVIANVFGEEAGGLIGTSGTKIASLGMSWSQCVNTRVKVMKTRHQVRVDGTEKAGRKRKRGEEVEESQVVGVRKMKVVWSSHLPCSACSYIVTSRGIRGFDNS